MIVGLEGGMGNQLFQLAFGLSVAKRRGEECFFTRYRLDSDPNGRKYELDHFAVDVKIVEREEPPILADTWYYNPGVYDPQWKSFTGHWQSEKYFDEMLVRSALRLHDWSSKQTLRMAMQIESQPSCFIHVRRGDYTLPDRIAYHGNVSENYYHRAIEHIRSQVPDVRFFVFSDEPFWCQDAFPRCTIVAHNQEAAHEDLWLMSLCNHAIICNSTFSWWGAYLGDMQNNRIVIAPNRWFVVSLNSSDVLPERWLKIDN